MQHRKARRVMRLRRLRRNSEMTQTDLGGRVGLSKSMIASIEAGTAKPSFDKAKAIAELFGEPIERIFSYEPVDQPIEVSA